MSLEGGAALGDEAFSSQAMLNHVLEEELLHLHQIAAGLFDEVGRGTIQGLEELIDGIQEFPFPGE